MLDTEIIALIEAIEAKNFDLLIQLSQKIPEGKLPDTNTAERLLLAAKHSESLLFLNHVWSLMKKESKTAIIKEEFVFRVLPHNKVAIQTLLYFMKNKNFPTIKPDHYTYKEWFFRFISCADNIDCAKTLLEISHPEAQIYLLNQPETIQALNESARSLKSFEILSFLVINMLKHNMISFVMLKTILSIAAKNMNLRATNFIMNLLGHESIKFNNTKSLFEQT